MRNKELDIKIRFLQEDDIEPIATAFHKIGWNKPASQYQRYLLEQEKESRKVLVAFDGDAFAGYLTIVWRPDYQPFQSEGIPEIRDFNVLPQVRRRGIGTQLMDRAEQMIAQRSSLAGIGVGMDGDYGAAQRLYVMRGYIPDGRGLAYKNQLVKYGEQITVDDDLVLHFVKRVAA